MPRVGDNALVFAECILDVHPHEHQAAYLLDERPIRVVVAGRRSGKSTAIACEVVFLAARAAAQRRPFHALLTGPVTDQARIPLATAERYLRASSMGGLVTRSVATPLPLLELGPDVSISVRPASEGGRHLRGHAFTSAYVDEAALIADATIEEAIMPTLADAGGRLTLASTPGVRGGLLHRLFERGQRGDDPRIRSFAFPSAANPHIDQAFVARQREELSHEQWAAEWLGQWLDPVDTCFRWADVLSAAVGELGAGGGGARHVGGFDPARSRDRSALVLVDAASSPRRVVHIEDLAGRPYPEQAERVARITREFRVQRLAVDATGVGAAVVELLRAAGVQGIEPIVFTASRKVDLVTGLVAAVEKRSVIFPAHADLLSEMRWLRVVRSPSGATRYESATRGHDDYCCALALAVAATGGAVPRPHPAHLGLSPFLRGSTLATGWDAIVSSPDGFPDDSWGPPY